MGVRNRNQEVWMRPIADKTAVATLGTNGRITHTLEQQE